MMNIENLQTIKRLGKFVKLSKQLQSSWHFLKNIHYSLEAHHFSKIHFASLQKCFFCNNLSKIQLCFFLQEPSLSKASKTTFAVLLLTLEATFGQTRS